MNKNILILALITLIFAFFACNFAVIPAQSREKIKTKRKLQQIESKIYEYYGKNKIKPRTLHDLALPQGTCEGIYGKEFVLLDLPDDNSIQIVICLKTIKFNDDAIVEPEK